MAESKKSRKHDRNSIWCEGYRRSDKQTLSHARRAWKHIQRYGATDHKAVHYLNNLSPLAKQKLKIPMSIAPVKSAAKRIAPRVAMPDGKGALPTPRLTRAA